MVNDKIVVVSKMEYEQLTHDSELANLTRKFLRDEEGSFGNLELLRFIYGISVKKEGA